MDKLVNKCMDENECEGKNKKSLLEQLNDNGVKMQQLASVQSLTNTPRNSWRQRKEVYSTQRRTKLQWDENIEDGMIDCDIIFTHN